MTTITIKDGKLSKTVFESLTDLQDYLTLQFAKKSDSFSNSLKNDLDRREAVLISNSKSGTPWEEIKSKLNPKN